METKGIIIVALQHPYYGKMAYNLCVSLQIHEPVDVTLVYDDAAISHLSEAQMTFFSKKIKMPYSFTIQKGKIEILKYKTLLNELSPYDKTIFLDADTLWNPSRRVQNLFDELKDVDFTIANRGYTKEETGMAGFSLWANIEEIRAAHGISSYLDASSEFIYWRKSEKADEIFALAKEIFETDPVTYRQFAGGKPDEPSFSIALSKLDFAPHKTPFYPSYWFYHTPQKYPSRTEILGSCWFLSFGGNQANKYLRKLYADVSTNSFLSLGAGVPFPLLEKNKNIKERAAY